MADERPQTLEAMRGIAGVGESKLAKYGQVFLDVVLVALVL
jgi:ATP-dependent DNA helicase RecQ